MIDWFRMNNQYPSHDKVLDLCDLLGEPLADAYVGRLWAYCGRAAHDGRIPGLNPDRSLERAVGWTGESGKLADAMVRCRIVDRLEDGGLEVHGWLELNGAAIAKAKRDAANAKARREAAKARRSSDAPATVARPSRDGRAFVALDQTRRDVDETDLEPPVPAGAVAPRAAGSAVLELLPTPAAPQPRRQSDGERFRAWFGEQRAEMHPDLPAEVFAAKTAQKLNAWYRQAIAAAAAVVGAEHALAALQDAALVYLRDSFGARSGWAWNVFTSAEVWSQRLPRAPPRRAERAAPPPTDLAALKYEGTLRRELHEQPAVRAALAGWVRDGRPGALAVLHEFAADGGLEPLAADARAGVPAARRLLALVSNEARGTA